MESNSLGGKKKTPKPTKQNKMEKKKKEKRKTNHTTQTKTKTLKKKEIPKTFSSLCNTGLLLTHLEEMQH